MNKLHWVTLSGVVIILIGVAIIYWPAAVVFLGVYIVYAAHMIRIDEETKDMQNRINERMRRGRESQ